MRIPLYSVAPGISVSFQELFILLYVIKYLRLPTSTFFIFKKEFTWFIIIAIVYVLYSFFLGMNLDSMVSTVRSLYPWCLVFIVPAFISDRQILVRTGILIFPVVIFVFASVIFVYITGNYIDHYLRDVGLKSHMTLEEKGLVRSYSAMIVTLYLIIIAFYFSIANIKTINYTYLFLVVLLGCLSIILSATRGWIIALSVLLIGAIYLYSYSLQIRKILMMVVVTAVGIFLVITMYPDLERQLQHSYQRLNTLSALAEGDVTAGGTLQRLDVRAPRVINKFRENPILGWGFSDEYYKYQDGHVGHHNILLNIGIIGYIYMNSLFIYLCLKIWGLAKSRQLRICEGHALLIFLFGLIAVFILHSSSGQFWGYTLDITGALFYSFFFSTINVVYLHYLHSNELTE
jgi:hypothetical protein